MSIAYGTNSADRSKAQQAWAKSQQSMASKYGIKPSNAMTYSFGRASPKSSDQQQGPLAEPPKQNSQAAQRQFGSAQASGDYSAYGGGGDYAAYGPQGENGARTLYGSPAPYIDGRNTPQSTEMRYRQPDPAPQFQTSPAPQSPTVQRGGVVRREDMFPQPGAGSRQPAMPASEYEKLTPAEKHELLTQPGVTVDGNGNVYQDLEKVRSQYGTRINLPPGTAVTADFVDSDRDGVDDRYQPAPGVKPQTGRPPQAGGQIHYGYGSQPAGQQPQMVIQPMPQQLPYGYGQPAPRPQSTPAYSPPQPQPQQYQPQQYVFPLQGQGPQFYNQRDAFINNINTSLGQQMMQNFGGAQPVAPQLNIPQLWAQAGEMAANGWTNPLAALIGNV